jgi:hypothetical protein
MGEGLMGRICFDFSAITCLMIILFVSDGVLGNSMPVHSFFYICLFTIKIPMIKLVRLSMNNNTCTNIQQAEN